jgi:hypothetical protein
MDDHVKTHVKPYCMAFLGRISNLSSISDVKMSEEDIRSICKKIIQSIIWELRIDVEDEVIERLTEGLMNSVRVLYFLSMMRANDIWLRLRLPKPKRRSIDIQGMWYPVRSDDLQRVVERDLPEWILRERIKFTDDMISQGRSLEDKFKLSSQVTQILFERNVEKELSTYSIAFETLVADLLKQRKRNRTINKIDLEELEWDLGKWFG